MNPKFALPVDTTEERLQTVVATAPISLSLSLRLRSHGCDHALGGQGSLEDLGLKPRSAHQSRLWPHQIVAPGGATFSFCIPSTLPKEIDPRFVSTRGLLTRTSEREDRHQSIITEPYQSMIAFPRTASHLYLMECRQERTALADEPQPRHECVSRIGMNYFSEGHIDFRD
jgi:hypothetical protein